MKKDLLAWKRELALQEDSLYHSPKCTTDS